VFLEAERQVTKKMRKRKRTCAGLVESRKWSHSTEVNEKLPSASQLVHWTSASGNVLEERHLWQSLHITGI
jgi:hypothetical protein